MPNAIAMRLTKRRMRRESSLASAAASAVAALPWRVIQRIAAPAIRSRIQASPCGQSVARESSGDERDGDEAEADQRPGPIAAVAQGGRGEGILLPLVGHHERRRQVDQDPRAAEQREDDEADAVDGRMDVEVAREPAADAGELAIRATALQALRRSITECVGAGFCHGSSLSGRGRFRYPE